MTDASDACGHRSIVGRLVDEHLLATVRTPGCQSGRLTIVINGLRIASVLERMSAADRPLFI